ncbi:MAG: hypothetical protein LBK67_01735 [Coriobacteriales bacterium]|jgi:hypothetical protein|nr:hypothetical protein [Coriobacteriales bacterium]
MKQHSNSIVLYHSSTVEVAEPQGDFAAGTDSAVNIEEMLAAYGLHILSPERAIAKLLEHNAVSLEGAS